MDHVRAAAAAQICGGRPGEGGGGCEGFGCGAIVRGGHALAGAVAACVARVNVLYAARCTREYCMQPAWRVLGRQSLRDARVHMLYS